MMAEKRALILTDAELYKVIHFLGLVKPSEKNLEKERKQCMIIMTKEVIKTEQK